MMLNTAIVNMNPDQGDTSISKHDEIIICVPTSSNALPEVDSEKVFNKSSHPPPEPSFGKLTSRGPHGLVFESQDRHTLIIVFTLIAFRRYKMSN